MKLLRYRLFIAVFLLIMIMLPFLLISFTTIALGAEGEEETKGSWLKGILLVIISFIINNFGENNNPGQVGEEPLIDEQKGTDTRKDTTPSTPTDREVLGFYVNWLSPDSSSYEALKNNWQKIDLMAPFWYTVTPEGEIKSRYGGHQYEIASFAKNRGLKVIPLINNSQTNNMMLVNPKIRKRAVYNIVELVDKYNYEGVNIDFEHIPPWTRNGYTSFIKELSRLLKKKNKLLTVSVFPKIGVPIDLQGAYDYGALGALVDRVVIMTYDYHWSTGPAGPIAPLKWVEKNIKYALEYIPRHKILLGIANYGYDWPQRGNARDLSAKEAVENALQRGAEIKWHDHYQSPYYYYWDRNGQKREVWFESDSSSAFKMDLVNKYNLKGIAIWRLGNGTNKFWNIIGEKIKRG